MLLLYHIHSDFASGLLLKNKNIVEKNIFIKNLIVTQSNDPSERTYKLEEGEPQENITTFEFLKKSTSFLDTQK